MRRTVRTLSNFSEPWQIPFALRSVTRKYGLCKVIMWRNFEENALCIDVDVPFVLPIHACGNEHYDWRNPLRTWAHKSPWSPLQDGLAP